MANIVRFGDRLINLEYTAEVDATTVPDGLATIHLAEGRSIILDGDTALAVRNFVNSYTAYPPSGPPPEGTLEFSSGSTGLVPPPGEVRKVHQGE